ncbi:hypothetical protein D777_02773 [Marinobacter nitratireducens]|uniref:DUF945 domain-containing protein n=1 Tax=Marinobacter nitratireducens TaxID=1137280 RepID=A0A072N001_9GAMM|nr:DUF945 family protein [Marinobacter nitratireducens]KEF30831.1 hypothetical protein D777_02773 [Marinobacter nitratireducens]
MQKKWMIAGAVALVAGGGMPWIVGQVTEKQWQLATQEVNRSQPLFQLNTEDYRRGYLNSQVHGEITLLNPETGESRSFGYRGNITHGVTGSLLDLAPADGWQPEGADWFSGSQPSLTVETRLWGSAVMNLDVPDTRLTDPNTGEVLQSSAGRLELGVTDAGASVDASMDWPSVRLTGPQAEIEVSGVRLEQTMAHLIGDVWTGDADFSVDTVSVTPRDDETVKVQGIAVLASTTATDDGERIDSTLDLSVRKAGTESASYGPHQFVVSLENFETASWNAFSEALSSMQTASLDPATPPQARIEQQMMAMQVLNKALRDLSAAGFSLSVPTLTMATPEGDIRGHLTIRHPELSAQEKAAMLMVMHRLTGELDVSMPLALAEEYPEIRMQVAPMIKQGWLVQDGDRLVVNATMKDLMVNVNGQEIPLPPLL